MMKNAFLLIAILLIGVIIFGCVQQQQASFNEQDARNFVNSDLNSKYPAADIKQIIEITPSVSNDSWYIKARVTFNYSTPCPISMNVYYDFPQKGFITTPPEYITRDCIACSNTATCVLGTPEQAIIASHTLNGSQIIADYISIHTDATPTANFYTEYLDQNSTKYQNIWIVGWQSPSTNFGVFSMISNTGQIIKNWGVTQNQNS